jgi:hypothetical protein
VVFEESPPCVLRSKNESHNGCIAHSSVQTLVNLLVGQPRGTANFSGPCVVQPEVDPLRTGCDVVQHVAQHVSLIGLDGHALFQQHALSCVVPCFLIIIEKYLSCTVLPHVGPHYMQPFRELLRCDGIFYVIEQLLVFLHHLHICTALQGLVYDSFNRKQNGVRF